MQEEEVSHGFITEEKLPRRATDRREFFIVIDGLDGIGKGEIALKAGLEYEQDRPLKFEDNENLCSVDSCSASDENCSD